MVTVIVLTLLGSEDFDYAVQITNRNHVVCGILASEHCERATVRFPHGTIALDCEDLKKFPVDVDKITIPD
jgi:hypothetical protein